MEEFDLGMALLTRAIDAARSASAVGLLPLPLATRADYSFRLGLWASAYADASEATALSNDTGQHSTRTYGLVALALVEAGQGRAIDCDRHASEAAELARAGGVQSIVSFADAALGLLALSDGRAAEAIIHLKQAGEMADRNGVLNPLAVQCQANLIEAYIRAGRTADAERALDTFATQAGSAECVWPRATAARCRGLLASEVEFEGPFEEALRWHDRLPMPFEQARTEFCFGERLRRARRVADGRDVLHRALAGFQQLGAARWAERTATELRATGERVPHPRTPARPELTPQELQVALLVARGATNREVASALFLSPKTVEFHLGHVYGKLSVRSRTEMVRVLLERDVGLPSPATSTAGQRPGRSRR
jgi:DNA-binding CsgD family transcriptional regulator